MTGSSTTFGEALQAVFGQLDWVPTADGTIHRFHVPGDKPGTLNGWYLLFADGFASGCFGSWKAGTSHIWKSQKPTNHLESQLLAQRIEQARLQREVERHQLQQTAAEYANQLWRKASHADPKHPYLTAKGVAAYTLRQYRGVLLVPLMQDGMLVNIQRIYSDASKRFLRGGMVKGCCSMIGAIQPGQPLYICEGWATGATLHSATGATVACAMNAGNLLKVGQRLQLQNPDTMMIVAGDDDRQNTGNPGRTAAIKAAAALSCGLIFPPWSGAEPLELSDFNDLQRWRTAQ